MQKKNLNFKKIIARTFLWTGGLILLLFLLVFIVLKFSSVQTYLTHKFTSSISNKTHTVVKLEKVDIRFPKSIILENIFVEDEKKDTLLFAVEIAVDVDMFKLFSKTIELNSVKLDKLTAHISRSESDSAFNFDFILKALSGDQKKQELKNTDTTSEGWRFNLEGISLANCFFTFNDSVSGTHLNVETGIFDVALNKLDLTHSVFDVDKINIEKTSLSFLQDKESTKKDTTTSPMPDIKIGKINLAQLKINYNNKVSGQQMAYNIGKIFLSADEMNLPQQIIKLNEVNVSGCQAWLAVEKNEIKKATDTILNPATSQPWNIVVKKIAFENNAFKMDDFNSAPLKNGMDFKHLFFTDFNADIKNLVYAGSSIKADIKNISAKEQCGFLLKHCSLNLTYDSTQAKLDNLNIQTAGTQLKDHLEISHPYLANISKSPGDAKLILRLKASAIQVKDILYFQPAISAQPVFAGDPDRILNVDADISGELKNLSIKDFVVSTGNATHLAINGTIKGLPDANKAFYDLTISKINSSDYDLKSLMMPQKLPANIHLPTRIALTGFFKGNPEKFDSKLALGTSAGGISAVVNMNTDKNKLATYTANVKILSLDAGYLLNDSSLGKISLNAEINGSGLKPEDMNTDIDLNLESATVKNYTYHDFNVKGNITDNKFTGTAAMNDTNLAFTFDGFLNLKKGKQQYRFNLDLKGADLDALHFQKEDLRVSGKVAIDLKGDNINNINGKAEIKNVLIIKKDKSYPIESFLFASVNEKRKADFSIESSLFAAKMNGTIALGEIGPEINHFINNYFKFQEEEKPTKERLPQQFTFSIELHNSPVISEVFLPELISFSSSPITGSYDSEKSQMILQAQFPQIVYAGNKIDSLNLDIHSDEKKINYNLGFNTLSAGSIHLDNTSLSGTVYENRIETKLSIKDDDNKQKLMLAGLLKSKSVGVFRFSFFDNVIINDTLWKVPDNNYVDFGSEGIMVNNFSLQNGAQLFSANSHIEAEDEPLEINFKDFELRTLSKIAEQDSSTYSGQINGRITLKNITKKLGFISDLSVKNFAYKEEPVGDIILKADNTSADRYTINASVTGNENKINLTGYFAPKDSLNNLNLDLNLENINLATVESFTNGQVTRATGNLAGNFKITGSSASPQMTGEVNFKNAGFHSAYINNYLKLDNEKIKNDPSGIYFSNFTIKDSLDNTAVLTGDINMQDRKNMKFNLDLRTKDFIALNTTAKDNELYYGKVILDSYITIRGDQNLPVVDIKAKLLDGSELTVAIPKEKYTTDKGEGVVIFSDTMHELSPIMTKKEKIKTNASEIKGLDLTSQLEINRYSGLKILVDPATGDSLFVRGDATLSFSIDPSGKMSLTGGYAISEGSYRVSLNEFIRKSFSISEGSTINWNGDMLDADVNIDAVYEIKTSPVDLVADQIAGLSEQEKNTYRQKLPFQVILHMKGQLMKPIVSFELQLPPEERGALGGTVYAKLNLVNQDESELNKQVFALLVLNRFIQQDPLTSSGGGSGTENAARESASKILSQQLNKFSDQFIKGVQLNLGVSSYKDYSTGQAEGRTELNVGVKKQLFNDRISVQVGGSVDLEGEKAKENKASDLAGDVVVEYKLTEDGRYRLKGFRENQYEGIFEGDIVETGAGLTYTRDFDTWKELFQKPVKPDDNK
jgi:hypothetical protein